MKNIVLLDLFSGIGGFAKGLSDGGFKIKKHYYSEIDKHAIANYKYNFKNAQYVGSVTDVQGGELERPNIITFGSPCQDFSLAGKRKGMEGQRSSLITEAIRLISECRPDVFIWENVKGTFSSNDGADFWSIIQAFTNIGGYRLEWQLLNTSWFLPQNRERIYLIGHLAGKSEPKVFPFREDDFIYNRPRETKEKIHSNNRTALTQQARQFSSWNGDFISVQPVLTPERKEKKQNGRRFKEAGEDSFTLTGQDKHGVMIKQINTSKESRGNQPYQQNRVYDSSGILPALNAELSGRNNIHTNPQIRRLTEVECERLQGFPDDWTKYGLFQERPKRIDLLFREKNPKLWAYKTKQVNAPDVVLREISMSQRYKMCGNSVTTNVVKEIGKRLLR